LPRLQARDPFHLVGTALEERFRIDSVVGEGGFGVVYRGHHLRLDTPIAVKCLKVPAHFTSEGRQLFLERFREEGKILLRLSDAPGVPRVFDYGVVSRASGEVPYLVMEWLDGHSLSDLLAARRVAGLRGLRPEDAIQLLLPAIDALAVAHEHHIAHRDIKPDNLLVVPGARGPTMKVLDFGIAKAIQEGESLTQSATHTATNFRAFTPTYAAPEQFAPKRYGASGPRTDVHALGLVLFELLTDSPAYPSDDFVECLEAATADARPSPRARGANVSDALEAVVSTAVARASERRYPTAQALAAALRQVPEAQGGVTGHAPGLLDAQPSTERALAVSAMVGPRPTDQEVRPAGEPRGPSSLFGTAPFAPGDARPGLTAIGPTPPPVTADRSSGSLVPPIPKASPTSRRQKGPRWGLIAAALVAAAGIGAAIFYVATRPPKKTKKKSPASATTASPETERTLWAHDFVSHRKIIPVGVATQAELAGKHHVRLFEVGGEVVRAERVGPAGNVTATLKVDHRPDGSLEHKLFSSRLVHVAATVSSKDHVDSYALRDGSVLSSGCALRSLKLSPAGDVVESTCRDPAGNVIIDHVGCPVTAYEVDPRHLSVALMCRLEGGSPTSDSLGAHLRKRTYDARALLVEEALFGTTGAPVVGAEGCAAIRATYDEVGNKTSETCVGLAGTPTPFAGGQVATTTYAYDARGCMVKATFKDAAGNPASAAGYAGKSFTRDEHCSEVGWATFGTAGALMSLPHQPARVTRKLDEHGDEIETRCFDERDQPMNCTGDRSLGVQGSVVRITRDSQGRAVSKRAFDAAGAPTRQANGYPHETRSTFNEQGLTIELRFFDAEGRPTLGLGSAAKRTFKYDALGSEIENAQFGLSGEPVSDATGAHKVRSTYDAKHRLVSIELRDTTDAYPARTGIRFGAVAWPRDAARLTVYRDGTRLENRFFDAYGKLLSTVDCNVPGTPCMY
jgi:serine/threonine protein kinase